MLPTLDEELTPIVKLAKALNIHVSTVYRWSAPHGIRGHRLRLTRIGGRTYVERRNWDSFLAAMNNGSPLPPQEEADKGKDDGNKIDAELDAAGL